MKDHRSRIYKCTAKVKSADNTLFYINRQSDLELSLPGLQGSHITITAFIIEDCEELLSNIILGTPAIKALKLDVTNTGDQLTVSRKGIEVGEQVTSFQNSASTISAVQNHLINNETLQKYSSVFTESITSFIHCTPIQIRLKHNRLPIIKPRRFSLEESEEFEPIIKRLLSAGVIQKSYSETASNARLVPKKNGSKRLVINYIPINRITWRDQYPLPNIEDLFLILRGSRYYSTLDCTEGFYQLTLLPEDRYKTAFYVPNGLYEFNGVPFGLTNSPAAFQRTMDEIFRDGLRRYCVVYIDDILVFGKNTEEHNKRLRWVLERCQTSNLKLKRSKCKIYKTEVEFLGHKISSEGISPVKTKMDTVFSYTPTDVTGAQTILGTVNYYSRFIPDYSTLTEPIRKAITGDKFEWGDQQKEALNKIRKEIDQAQPHHIASPEEPKIIEIITKDNNIEVICFNTEYKLIARAGQVLTEAQAKYTIPEKVLLATLLAFKKFGIFLSPETTKLMTSCQTINSLINEVKISPRIEKLMARLPPDLQLNYIVREPSSLSELITNEGQLPEEVFYTDGACLGNGKSSCKASWAVCATFKNHL